MVIRPGGVDICGTEINLNGGGRPGTPAGTLVPGVLKPLAALAEESEGPSSGQNGDKSENNGASTEQDEPETEEFPTKFLFS